MARGVIWGHWDSLHAGQQAALTKAFSECEHVIVILIIGPEKDKESIKQASTRKNNLKKWIKDAGYKKDKYTYLEYVTVEDAVADAGNLDFTLMYLAEHEYLRDCAVQLKQSVDDNRAAASKPYASYSLVPTVTNTLDEPMHDTKYRKRQQLGWDTTDYFKPKKTK